MAHRDNRFIGGPALLEAPEPRRKADPGFEPKGYVWSDERGTGNDNSGIENTRVGLWLTRFRIWREAFEQSIGPKARKYWADYRAFDNAPLPGPKQAWRDTTVIPEVFKIIESRLPRKVMGQFGAREWFSVEGRDSRDESYEEMTRTLIRTSLDLIGKRDYTDGGFYKRVIDGMRYCDIVGHVWWKVWWRNESRWLKTKLPTMDAEGKVIGWDPIEVEDLLYDNVDFTWIPLDSVAVDTANGMGRRWLIERVDTTMESLHAEDAEYQRKHGVALYPTLDQIDVGAGVHRDGFEEPRDTEHWPLTTEAVVTSPGETAVELWLCWDNQKQTLTKIVNRTHELDHGLAPTPDGLDPFISTASVPIPGRAYGESMIHWIGPLITYQNRIARARADEVLLNIWQQWVFRAGAVTSSQGIHAPGAALFIDSVNPDRPITDNFSILPRRPVFQEAYTEEAYRQQQAEATAGADSISMGVEATQKSRDVAATEIQQRVAQGGVRYQMENLYLEVAFKKPLLQKVFDLLRQNLTAPRSVRVLNEDVTVDLRSLHSPIDIVVGGGIMEMTKTERMQEVQAAVTMAESPVLGPYLKPQPILTEFFKNNFDRKDPSKFVKTEEEVEQDRAKAAQAAMAQAGAAGGGGTPPGMQAPPTPVGGQPADLAGPSGQGAPAAPTGPQPMVEDI